MSKKLVFITGRSSSGKNTFANILLTDKHFVEIPMHTTRPKRDDTDNGYIFDTPNEFMKDANNHEYIETRSYLTNQGCWYYGTKEKDLTNFLDKDVVPVIVSGTPILYKTIKDKVNKLGFEIIVVYLIEPDKVLLQRAINREKLREIPDYAELCRRFLADKKDYSDEETSIFPDSSGYLQPNLQDLYEKIKTDSLK